MSNGEPESFIPYNEWQDAISPPEDSAQNLHFSDSDEDDVAQNEDDAKEVDYSEHYSQQMSELFDDDENESADESTSNILGNVIESDDEDDEDDGEFVYTGVDSSTDPMPYRDQLRDVLGQEHEEGSPEEAKDLEPFGSEKEVSITIDDEPSVRLSCLLSIAQLRPMQEHHEMHEEVLSELSPSSLSPTGPMTPPSRMGSPAALLASPRLSRPFLHPNVSRLRSATPQMASPLALSDSLASSHSHLFEGASPSPSGFSSISRTSSVSNLRTASSAGGGATTGRTPTEVFRWSELQIITKELYPKAPASQKAMNVLGSSAFGSPTVLAANGLICIGLNDGRICVYDFKQTLKAVCGSEAKGV